MRLRSYVFEEEAYLNFLLQSVALETSWCYGDQIRGSLLMRAIYSEKLWLRDYMSSRKWGDKSSSRNSCKSFGKHQGDSSPIHTTWVVIAPQWKTKQLPLLEDHKHVSLMAIESTLLESNYIACLHFDHFALGILIWLGLLIHYPEDIYWS